MNLEEYIEGENPLTGEDVGLGTIPRYALGAAGIIVSVGVAQFGVSKLAEMSGVEEVEGAVPEV